MDLLFHRSDLFVRVRCGLDLAHSDALGDGEERRRVRAHVGARAANEILLFVVGDEAFQCAKALFVAAARLFPLGEVLRLLLGIPEVEEVILLEAAHVDRGDQRVVGEGRHGDVDVHDVRCGVD